MIWIDIDKSTQTPLIRQIYEQIRFKILSGQLKAGEKLPPTRRLASDLGISRIVVMEAYEQLIAEGYLEGRQGSGTTVADGIYPGNVHEPAKRQVGNAFAIQEQKGDLINFRTGVPAVDTFPKKEWGQLLQKTCIEMPPALFGYDQPQGRPELRQAIAEYLLRARGVDCDPDQIYITAGTTQSLAILLRILYFHGAEAILEDPTSEFGMMMKSSEKYNFISVPVDNNGIRTDLLTITEKTSFVFVTPSHQFPLGGVLPIQRRLELINLSRNTNCYIIEDDYDSEFRFAGHPISSMYSCEPNRVIYLGTFSKAFSPALRLGYAILPDTLGPRFLDCKYYMDEHNSLIEQLAMARFINEGRYEKHISKMKKIYHQRQKSLIKALEDNFPGRFSISGHSTGLHLIVEFPNVEFTDKIQKAAIDAGVRIHPVESLAIEKGRHCSKIVMGYGHLTADEIKEGIRRLKSVIAK